MFKIIALLIIIVLFFVFLKYTSGNKKAALENEQKGVEYLAANRNLEGVETTESGLQYKVLQQGTGDQHPKATDTVKVHYHGTLLDGSVFDSSVERGEPIEFGLHQVIKGWTEGLQLMVVGEKTRLFIPSELAYGSRAAGSIAPGSTLIFDVELLGINQ
ncbi:MAG: peptidylprolyl isomerase [Halieaceae bacterium]